MLASIKQQFMEPSEEYTPIPFWFWNDRLTKEEILRQINEFYQKGVTGFVLHPRIGIPEDMEYLSDSFMDLVQEAVKEADRLGMQVILYDEAMYPSGSAHGRVVKDNPEYASRGLAVIEYKCTKMTEIPVELEDGQKLVSSQAIRRPSASTIDLDSVQLIEPEQGRLLFTPPDEEQWSIFLFIETFSKGTIRGIHFGEDDGEENPPASADLLNKDAVAKYIQLTHDRYYACLSNYFGNTIMAMFTDEPDILGRGALPGLKPWTNDFLLFYTEEGNQESHLAGLWFDAGEQTTEIRQRFRKTVNKRLLESYYNQISSWCENHDIALTGHPAASDDIGLLESFQIPGQDVVWRWVGPEDGKGLEGEHSTAGKCSADAARHRNRRRNLNEFLGVCGKESEWALSPGDMKWYIDWLGVRGVNLFCPHAFYYSVEGKRRSHERPPDVGPNNTWWPYYKQFAQYMKRISWLMTDSVNQTKIAVLCEEDHLPWKAAKPLYENQIEFNYLEESLLQSPVCSINNGAVSIARQAYHFLIIENVDFLTPDLINKLENFIQQGGTVIYYGDSPEKVIKGAKNAGSPEQLIEFLHADVRAHVTFSPQTSDIRISLVKKDNLYFYMFVNEGEHNFQGKLSITGNGRLELWDAWKGLIEEVPVDIEEDLMTFPVEVSRRESVVYCLDPEKQPIIQTDRQVKEKYIEFPVEDWFVTEAPVDNGKTALSSWTEWDGMEQFSGTVKYESNFELNESFTQEEVFLDLGEVHEIADVSINGMQLGTKMWSPYTFNVPVDFLKPGKNMVTIKVTNSTANQMDHARLKSGLIGPVIVEVFQLKNAVKPIM